MWAKSAPEPGQGISLTVKCNTVLLFRLTFGLTHVGQSSTFEQVHKYRAQYFLLLARFIGLKNQNRISKII